MKNIRGNTLIINGQTADASGFTPDPSAVLFYEVIRVIDGQYLFMDDHLERLYSTCIGRIKEVPDESIIAQQLKQLVDISSIMNGNVKLMLYEASGMTKMLSYFTPHFYPENRDYKLGVHVKTFKFERPDPNIKRWNEAFRKRVNNFIKEEGIYEAILLNEEGQLTEGSRSNLFFIDNQNHLFTAPTEQVLPGITRKYVFQICDELGIPIIERAISLKDISAMSACFISGTSPKILPVRQLDNTSFSAEHELVKNLMLQFDQLISESIS